MLYSVADYSCACHKGYRGEFCTKSHLLPFEIVLIVAATAALTGFVVVLAVKRYRYIIHQMSKIQVHNTSNAKDTGT